MITDYQIPEPILLNPLKYHPGFIKKVIDSETNTEMIEIIRY